LLVDNIGAIITCKGIETLVAAVRVHIQNVSPCEKALRALNRMLLMSNAFKTMSSQNDNASTGGIGKGASGGGGGGGGGGRGGGSGGANSTAVSNTWISAINKEVGNISQIVCSLGGKDVLMEVMNTHLIKNERIVEHCVMGLKHMNFLNEISAILKKLRKKYPKNPIFRSTTEK
jgi:hypothetical protein